MERKKLKLQQFAKKSAYRIAIQDSACVVLPVAMSCLSACLFDTFALIKNLQKSSLSLSHSLCLVFSTERHTGGWRNMRKICQADETSETRAGAAKRNSHKMQLGKSSWRPHTDPQATHPHTHTRKAITR